MGCFAVVAQQVERSAVNRLVTGSSPANHFGLSSRRLGFESRSEHFLYLKDIWESPSLSKQRGCPSGQRRQAQDLLTQVYQGSNPCSRIFFYCYYFYPIQVFFMPGQGRRSSYGTVDPVTRVQISAPAPFLNFFIISTLFRLLFIPYLSFYFINSFFILLFKCSNCFYLYVKK